MLISTNLIPWDLRGSFEKTAMRVGSINCQKKKLSRDYESCCQVKHTPHTRKTDTFHKMCGYFASVFIKH